MAKTRLSDELSLLLNRMTLSEFNNDNLIADDINILSDKLRHCKLDSLPKEDVIKIINIYAFFSIKKRCILPISHVHHEPPYC
jgi:hypothetical protein